MGEQLPLFVLAQASDRCLICGRKLTDPRSCLLGIGPVCRARSAPFSAMALLVARHPQIGAGPSTTAKINSL